ncbi:hypothetical protein V8D89_006646 [Ganoderma adspersum]
MKESRTAANGPAQLEAAIAHDIPAKSAATNKEGDASSPPLGTSGRMTRAKNKLRRPALDVGLDWQVAKHEREAAEAARAEKQVQDARKKAEKEECTHRRRSGITHIAELEIEREQRDHEEDENLGAGSGTARGYHNLEGDDEDEDLRKPVHANLKLHSSGGRTFVRSDQALDTHVPSLKRSGQPHRISREPHAPHSIATMLLRARAGRNRGINPTHEGTISQESGNNNRTNRNVIGGAWAISVAMPRRNTIQAGVLNIHSINAMWRADEIPTCQVEYKARLLDDSKMRWELMYNRTIARHKASAWNGRRTTLDDAYFYYKMITNSWDSVKKRGYLAPESQGNSKPGLRSEDNSRDDSEMGPVAGAPSGDNLKD